MEHVLTPPRTTSARNLTYAVLAGWFLLALGGSLLGAFDSQPRPPIALGLAAAVPIVLFGFCYLKLPVFQEFVLSLNLRLLTLAQIGRTIGITFVILYYQSALPGVFALPAGWGDVAIGITAPIAAWYWRSPFPRRAFVVWNVLGIIDLLLAVTLGVLASQTPIGLLAGDVSTRLMGQFPLSLIPTFFVPLFVIFHAIALIRVRKEAF